MNFYEKRNKKSAFSRKELASMLNVDEEKIKELENGKRSITGETLDEYMKFINMTRKEKTLMTVELMNWLNSVSIKDLREEFGLKNQRELCDVTGVGQSVISEIESGKRKKPSFLTLYKLHKFFTNDFNIIVEPIVRDTTSPSDEVQTWVADGFEITREPIKNEHSTFEITPECFEEDKEPETTIPKYKPVEVVSIAPQEFEGIDMEKEELKKKIARYEKIIDYILREEK